jgi:hypothetical protein
MSLQDREDGGDPTNLPDLEKVSPIITIRRKSPERPKNISSDIIRSVSPLPQSPKKGGEGDLWTAVTQPIQTYNAPPVAAEKKVQSSKNKFEPPGELPENLGSAVLEIQTVLRRDIERLRLDMVRQFVSFKSEISQKWEGEVDRLRQENEMLTVELNTLKKQQEKKKEERGNWHMY